MSVIEASSVNVKTMADNTLRLTVDIEPRFAKDAFALFSERGTPIALAALRVAKHEPEKADKPKGGLLSQWAALRCQEPEFQRFLAHRWPASWEHAHERGGTQADLAAEIVRLACQIQSRADLDNDPQAAARFDKLIRVPWQKHYQAAHACKDRPE